MYVIASELSEFYVETSKSISAKVLLKDNDSLSVSVLDDGKSLSSKDIDVSSERKHHISFDDYNRDGYKDFSVWHLDEEMGTYKIYRVFVFSSVKEQFEEIKPTCGNEFINIRIEGDDLINVIYEGNTPKPCSMPLKTLK